MKSTRFSSWYHHYCFRTNDPAFQQRSQTGDQRTGEVVVFLSPKGDDLVPAHGPTSTKQVTTEMHRVACGCDLFLFFIVVIPRPAKDLVDQVTMKDPADVENARSASMDMSTLVDEGRRVDRVVQENIWMDVDIAFQIA